MKVLIVIACFVTVAFATPNAEWENFKTTFVRKYKNAAQEEYRKNIFLDNLKTIEEHNERYEKDEVSFTLRVNQFADMTTKEFASKMNGYRSNPKPSQGKPFVLLEGTAVPDKVDWRDQGYVTPVKDQGQCGSCWSFSATGSLEGQHFAKTGKLVSLSEQNLMDCTWSYGNTGCDGGWMDPAFQYIIDNNGVDTEAAYPYEEADNVCRYDPSQVGATATGFVDIAYADEDSLQGAAGTIGPVSVAIDASHISFQLYSAGVYDEPQCSQDVLDHGVLVIGYGTDLDKDYWLVKNSWGTTWGMAGYIEMSRNKSNQCGIASKASYPTV